MIMRACTRHQAVVLTDGLAPSLAGDLRSVAPVVQANGTEPGGLVLQSWQIEPHPSLLIHALATQDKFGVQGVLVVGQQAVVLAGSACTMH